MPRTSSECRRLISAYSSASSWRPEIPSNQDPCHHGSGASRVDTWVVHHCQFGNGFECIRPTVGLLESAFHRLIDRRIKTSPGMGAGPLIVIETLVVARSNRSPNIIVSHHPASRRSRRSYRPCHKCRDDLWVTPVSVTGPNAVDSLAADCPRDR